MTDAIAAEYELAPPSSNWLADLIAFWCSPPSDTIFKCLTCGYLFLSLVRGGAAPLVRAGLGLVGFKPRLRHHCGLACATALVVGPVPQRRFHACHGRAGSACQRAHIPFIPIHSDNATHRRTVMIAKAFILAKDNYRISV